MTSNLNFIQNMLLSTHLISALSVFNMFYLALRLLFLIFTVVYVYKDSQRQGMDRFFWILVAIFVPNHLGFMTYLVVRTMRNNSYSNNENSLKDYAISNIKITKSSIYKFLSILLVILMLSLMPSMGDTIKSQYHKFTYGEVIKKDELFESQYRNFNGEEEKQIRYPQAGNLTINYSSKVKRGSLVIGIYHYNGKPIKTFETNRSSSITIPIEKNRIYRLIATGDSTKGHYKFNWKFNSNN